MFHAPVSEYLEAMNGAWAVLEFYFCCWMAYYVWRSLSHAGGQALTFRDMARRATSFGYQRFHVVAIAILIFHLGDLLRAGSVWFWRHLANQHGVPPAEAWVTVVPLVTTSAVIACTGLLLKIWLFADRHWGVWAALLLIATAFLMIFGALNYLIF